MQEVRRNNEDLESELQGYIEYEQAIGQVRDEEWTEKATNQISNNWASRANSKYQHVEVLLTSWASDKMGVSKEIDELCKVFSNLYNFDVHQFLIPDIHPVLALATRASDLIKGASAKALLIFYYAGHGAINELRGDAIWAP